jgi:Reverse transcriptase (RNA-dependent DNA polymerase)
MEEWRLKKSDLKKYPHFDPVISTKKAEAFATNPDCVAHHAFYPFIRYRQRWTRFAEKGGKGAVKERPIRYAARRDAYIFSRYRHLLSQHYEAELTRLGLDASVLAYRRIPATDSRGGKCNIHFARDAFLKIRELGNCFVIALDVSSYFESLDHARLKQMWCRMLGANRLPADHFKVFEAITKYAVVDKVSLYERLGYYGDKTTRGTNSVKGYLSPYDEMPKQLCRGKRFRELIRGGGGQKSILEKNYKDYGIPQGAPISDLLANLYLLDFDSTVAGWVREIGGAYYRYSDDILIVAPGAEAEGTSLMARTRDLIRRFGARLEIKEKKSSLFVFRRHDANQDVALVLGTQGKNGLEYLGFRYNGKKVYLRDATISNLRRNVARAANRDAYACARRYPDKDVANLRSLFNYERLIKRFGKVEDFNGTGEKDYRNQTFWTYANHASKVFGPLGKPILRQLRKHRELVRWRADKALERAVVRRERRKTSQAA